MIQLIYDVSSLIVFAAITLALIVGPALFYLKLLADRREKEFQKLKKIAGDRLGRPRLRLLTPPPREDRRHGPKDAA